jgi:hypothetical protein
MINPHRSDGAVALRRANQKQQAIEKLASSAPPAGLHRHRPLRERPSFPGAQKPTRLNVHRYWRVELDHLIAPIPAQTAPSPSPEAE